VEWHLTPEYVLNNWTDELLDLMIQKMVERKEREMKQFNEKDKTVSDEQLFGMLGNKIKRK